MSSFPTTQQKAAMDCRGKSLIVSAAAGAGKTSVLVGRIVELICDAERPVDIDRLLVVTYTNAAAAEMRGRVAEAISRKLEQNPADRRLRRQLALLQSASIQTVHSFCRDLISKNFTLAGVSPDFMLADEIQSRQIKELAMEAMLEQEYRTGSAAFGELRLNICEERGDLRLEQAIMLVYEKLRSHPNPEKWLELEALRQPTAPELTEWGREILQSARESLRYARGRVEAAREELEAEPEICKKYAPAFERCVGFAQTLEAAMQDGWDCAVRALESFDKPKMAPAPRGSDTAFTGKMKAARDAFADRIEGIRKSGLMQGSADVIEQEMRSRPLIAELCRLAARFSDVYSECKAEKNMLDFSDLEHIALGLLQTPGHEKTELALELSEHFQEVLVDEYQDTNELQERIFQRVIREGGSAFFVGDVKQSIYRFRLADPAIFIDRLRSGSDLPTESWRARLALSDNFRTFPAIIGLCNHVFSRIMRAQFGDVEYGDGHGLIAGRTEAEGGAELWIIETAGLGGEDEVEQAVTLEARLAAARITDILQNEQVYEKDGACRAARPSDCAILLSSFEGKSPYFADELRRAGVPVLSPESESFFAGVEITVMLSLLRIIDNPRQDIPLISVLRSPLVLFSSDDLAEVRLSAPNEDFYTALLKCSRGGHAKSAEFLRRLRRLRALARDLPVSALVRRIYRETEALGVFSALEAGQSRVKNLAALYQMTLAFESEGSRGLAAFLRHIDAKIAANASPQVAVSGEGVRIMSIHKSKGLEFPFVVLPDLNKRFNTDDSKGQVLFHQHVGLGLTLREPALRAEYKTAAHTAISARIRREGGAEELRKLYVAMTRAKQRLVMIMSRSGACEKLEEWRDEARGGIEPEFLAAQQSAMPWLCAALADYPGMCAPDGTALGGGAGFFGKIIDWRDIEPASWQVQSSAGEPEQSADGEDMLAMEALGYPFAAASALPSKLTPTGVRLLAQDSAEIERESDGAARVRMYRRHTFAKGSALDPAARGTAIHALLRYLNLDACMADGGVESEVLRVAMLGHLSPEEAMSIDAAQVRALVRSPLAGRIREARERLHEYEFSALFTPDELLGNGITDDTILLNGAIDLLLFTEQGIEVVDFKSDAIAPGFEARQAERHRLQLSLYAAAAERIFERPILRKTVWFTATGGEAAL